MSDLADLISIVIVTSPTASDPSTDTLNQTIDSILAADDEALMGCRCMLGADGVRPEQRDLTDRYWQKVNAFDRGDSDCVLRMPAWGHQANVMRMLLAEVTTPLILFAEHDTPLTPNVQIDWQGCADTLMDGELDSIRFLHESHILGPYEHLMLGEHWSAAGVPYIRTAQWSQRPHLARADWYRDLIQTYFALSSRCFIEDVAYGVVNYHWRTYGFQGLDRWRLGIYADPEPTMQRSDHLDGRAGDPKGGQVFAYPGDTIPEGAPYPTLMRTEFD